MGKPSYTETTSGLGAKAFPFYYGILGSFLLGPMEDECLVGEYLISLAFLFATLANIVKSFKIWDPMVYSNFSATLAFHISKECYNTTVFFGRKCNHVFAGGSFTRGIFTTESL